MAVLFQIMQIGEYEVSIDIQQKELYEQSNVDDVLTDLQIFLRILVDEDEDWLFSMTYNGQKIELQKAINELIEQPGFLEDHIKLEYQLEIPFPENEELFEI